MLRQLAEYVSRGKIFKRRILVNGEKLPLLVSPDAQLKYLKPGIKSFDQDLIDIAERYLCPDSNVWDIGANVGVFTFAAASVAHQGSIVSVEADIWLANMLRKTTDFKEYDKSHIAVLPVAISNKNTVASFFVAARGRASNALKIAGGGTQMGGVREKQHVPTLTLDTLLESFSAPDFIKIDVEGAEQLVLQGATSLISKVRPIFYMEVGRQSFDGIMTIFRDAHYVALDHRGNVVIDSSVFNIFFIPEEKADYMPF